MTEITRGTAVRHRTRQDLGAGRVRHIIGSIATVTWVGRRNVSCVRVANLEPITDAELARAFHEREAEQARVYAAWSAQHGTRVSPEPPSDENRRFLLGESADPFERVRRRCWPDLAEPMESHS